LITAATWQKEGINREIAPGHINASCEYAKANTVRSDVAIHAGYYEFSEETPPAPGYCVEVPTAKYFALPPYGSNALITQTPGKKNIFVHVADFDAPIITGIRETPGTNEARVTFSHRTRLTGAGKQFAHVFGYDADVTESTAFVDFQKYDDGWRVVGRPYR
jgi:hypothetical protein